MIKKLKYLYLIILILISFGIFKLDYNVNAQTTTGLTIEGNINYKIKESGNNTSPLVKKILNNYPCTLIYNDNKGKNTKISFETDENGNFHVDINGSAEINEVWIEIISDNEACYVTRRLEVFNNARMFVKENNSFDIKPQSIINKRERKISD